MVGADRIAARAEAIGQVSDPERLCAGPSTARWVAARQALFGIGHDNRRTTDGKLRGRGKLVSKFQQCMSRANGVPADVRKLGLCV